MLRSIILSTSLVACSAAGAVGLSALHQVSFDREISELADPNSKAAFVIPAFAQTSPPPVKMAVPISFTPTSFSNAEQSESLPEFSEGVPDEQPSNTSVETVSATHFEEADSSEIEANMVETIKPRSKPSQKIVTASAAPLNVTGILSGERSKATIDAPIRQANLPKYFIGVYR